jgi:membrane-associated protease RseP (regulator of RpoE activity)
MRTLTRAISGSALLLALAFSGRAGAADAPAQPKADEQLIMPKMVVQGIPICSFGISLKILGDVTTKKITRIFISEVISRSRAEFIGLRPGDEILAVNGLKIADLKGGMSRDGDIMQLFGNRKKGDAIDLKIAVRMVKDLTLFAAPPLFDDERH